MSTVGARHTAELAARVVTLEAEMAAMKAQLALLQRARPNRDQADANLRQLLPASTRELPFKVQELLRHAAVDEHLKAALIAADINSSSSLGTWLRDRAGTQNGVAIVRLPGRGRRWQARHVDTYVSNSWMSG